jgi:transcription elongation GreA/GreB family factor
VNNYSLVWEVFGELISQNMDKYMLLMDHFQKQRKSLVRAIDSEKKIRDSSPSAMQSHHDTTRNQTEKLVTALEHELSELDRNIALIPEKDINPGGKVTLWSYIELKQDGETVKLIIVPEGMGGSEAEGIKLVSETTPLGIKLISKKEGDKCSFNEKQQLVKRIR